MTAAFVQLRSRLAKAELEARVNVPAKAEDAVLMLEGDADVYKPDGEPLVLLRRGVFNGSVRETARPILRELRKNKTNVRAAYTGATRHPVRFTDGSTSKSSHTKGAAANVSSAIVGYFDRQGGHWPLCRATAFTGSEVEKWRALLPFIDQAAEAFRRELPTRHRIQMDFVGRCRSEFVIRGTPFTTLTVNNDVAPSGIHRDAGDFKDGFGLIGCLRRGMYRGAWLVFPEYQVGVDLRDGDLLFFNSHDWHGVTPMLDKGEDAERISIVFYARSKMVNCKSPAEELRNAKRVRGAL